MLTKLQLGMIVVGVLSVTGVVFLSVTNTEEVAPEVVTEVVEKSPVDELTDEIYHSEKFQEEMRAMALARAKYQLSQETQEKAVRLAEEALESYQYSNDLANEWKLNQTK